MEEIWLPVKDFPGYEISSQGRLRSRRGSGGGRVPLTTSAPPKILVPCANSKGYLIHGLMRDRKRNTKHLHRLVAEHFVEGYRPGLECSHLDGDKRNCCSSNLRWEDHRSNMRRQRAHETDPVGIRNPRCKLTLEQVNSVKPRRDDGESLSALAREFGVSVAAVWAIYHGRAWRRRD